MDTCTTCYKDSKRIVGRVGSHGTGASTAFEGTAGFIHDAKTVLGMAHKACLLRHQGRDSCVFKLGMAAESAGRNGVFQECQWSAPGTLKMVYRDK